MQVFVVPLLAQLSQRPQAPLILLGDNALFPHNLTACIVGSASSPEGLRLCHTFHAFNFSACLAGVDQFLGTPESDLPPVAACLNHSSCLPLYGVPSCIGSQGLNLSLGSFNTSVCLQLTRKIGLYFVNGTGCGALLHNDTNGVDDNSTFFNASTVEIDNLPHFHPCRGAFNISRLQRLDFLQQTKPAISYMVVAVSPEIGPVTGGVNVAVCGIGFRLTNDGVNHLKCRFSDGYNALEEPAVYVDTHMLRCRTPDFSRFSIALPHRLTVDVSLGRGAHWTNNNASFILFSTRPSIDALGRPVWGYDPTFTKAAWQVEVPPNEFGWLADPLYPPSGSGISRGRPSTWDARSDPFHSRGAEAYTRPTQQYIDDRMPTAADIDERARLASKRGVEGSWGDRMSFMRAHYLVPDTYRHAVVEARERAVASAMLVTNGDL